MFNCFSADPNYQFVAIIYRLNSDIKYPGKNLPGIFVIISGNGIYYSCGGTLLPGRLQLLETFTKSKVPDEQTVYWRPFISRENCTFKKIALLYGGAD